MTALTPEIRVQDVLSATAGRLARGRPDTALAGVSIDSRTLHPGQLFMAIRGPRLDGHDFVAEAAARGAAGLLVSRAVALPDGPAVVVVEDTTRALAHLARARRDKARIPVVAVTGSVGKTTTKEMAAALLATRGPVLKTEGNLNNQYGLPLTLLRLAPSHAAAVLELGMSAAGELRALTALARPDVAVITRVAPVHLEFFASVDDIARAKAEILEGLGPSGVAVLNRDDLRVRRIGEGHAAAGGRVLWFGREGAAEVCAAAERAVAEGTRFDLRLGDTVVDATLPLRGPHFVSNFLAAAAAAHAVGIPPEAIAAATPSLQAARHRGQVVRLGQGVLLLDDCYNSSPVAVEAAVTALGLEGGGGRRLAFLGDMLELGPEGPALHRQAGRAVSAGLDALVAVGPLARHFLEGAREAGLDGGACHEFADAAAAAAAVGALLRPGDAVLVKGSRGVKLEQVVEAVRARFAPEGV